MTTILAHRQTLYADSRCSVDNAAFRMQKIFAVRVSVPTSPGSSPWVIACAGETYARERFFQHVRSYMAGQNTLRPPEGLTIPDEDFSALVINAEGIWHFDHRFAGDKVDGLYFAIGTGQEAVLGAIEAQKLTPSGMDPLRAMMAACKVDVAHSGGPIQHMTWGEFVLHKESV